MLSLAKRAARQILQSRGYELHNRASMPYGIDWMQDVARLAGDQPIEVFFDVGAHIGETAEAALNRFPKAKVFAFEPHPDTFAVLNGRNYFPARFECHNLAMSDMVGRSVLFCNRDSPRNSMVFNDSDAKVDVECSTIDEFLSGLQLSEIDVLKTDTEGMDLAVLRGGRDVLSKGSVRFVCSEFYNDGTGTTLPDLLSFLQPFRFRLIATYTEGVINRYRYAWANALFALS
jgi:FkbM family methyltransferase